ncbi:FAD/NAD(P)-binding protein [Aureimonas sp. AU12]|uniref:FAD/NAD(P)-binding protein n=1 Tax=Aureimonas sp. AU12 TaxID=1638161 RepID=UPI001FCDCD04|nr:FAD/NAD(P)-binding protein [Aureimonas sp. AU12]
MRDAARRTVVIVGGGCSGAVVAHRLASAPGADDVVVVVVEPRPEIGPGLAYSTQEAAHRINVPASKMSLFSDDLEDFTRWLATADLPGADALDANGDAYPRRAVFGRYLAERMAPLVRSGAIRHERQRAETISRQRDGGFDVRLEDGGTLGADIVVIATTHPPPAVPQALAPLVGQPGFIPDVYVAGALDAVRPTDRVLIVGNGLTAADVVAALDGRGHVGGITSLSRQGLRSRGHAGMAQEPIGDFTTAPETSALALLRRIRRTVRAAEAVGASWHFVLDAVRNQGPEIWQALPVSQRRKVVRRLRSVWDVHRFRIAPQVEAVLERRSREGRYRSLAASLEGARPTSDGLEVAMRPRGSGAIHTALFDVVVNTTGPAHRSVVERAPLRSLFEAGLVGLDEVGLGLAVALDGRTLDKAGDPVAGLYVAGPLARGTVGELMGLYEVANHAVAVADAVREAAGEVSVSPAEVRTKVAAAPPDAHGEPEGGSRRLIDLVTPLANAKPRRLPASVVVPGTAPDA